MEHGRLGPFLQRWMVTTFAVLVAAHVVSGIHYDSLGGLLVASLLLGMLNAFIRPVLILLSLPLLIFSMGLALFFINALLLYFVGSIVKSFQVDSLWAAFWGGLVVSLVSMLGNFLIGTRSISIHAERGPRRRPPGDGGGPVIDV